MTRTSEIEFQPFENTWMVDQEPTTTFGGLKENSPRRLYLHLVTDSGTLMWKTELPYTIEKGAKDLDEEV